ncbi:hypothetical protein [Roseateles sp. P5_E4]
MSKPSSSRRPDRRRGPLSRNFTAALWAALRRIARRRPRQPASPVQLPLSKSAAAEAEALARALAELLGQHPSTRRVMRHLGYVEHQLARQGAAALSEMPVHIVATALSQLEAIVSNWSNRDLAELRSRMAVAVKKGSEDEFLGPDGERRSVFATASRLLVGDVNHSVFEELQRQYHGLVSPEGIEAALGVAASRATKAAA